MDGEPVQRERKFSITERIAVLGIPLLLAALGAALSRHTVPSLAPLIPGLFLVAAVCNAASALALVTAQFDEQRDASIMLAVFLGADALFAFALALVTPVSASAGPVVAGGRAAPIWILVLWHAFIAGSAIAYALRRRISGHVPRAYRAVLWICGAGLVAYALRLAYRFRDILNPTGSMLSTAFTNVIGPVELVLCILGTIAVATLPRSLIDRAFGLAMFIYSLDLGLFVISPDRYSLGRIIARVLIVLGSAIVLAYLMRGLLLDRFRLFLTQRELRTATAESTLRAAQFRALWQAATVDQLADREFFQTITDLGSANLRPGHGIYGYVSQFLGDELIVEASSFGGTVYAVEDAEAAPMISPAGNIERHLKEAGRTIIYEATNEKPEHWKSAIGTPITMGAAVHFLVFAALDDLHDKPFVESDVGFVEVLGSQISHRYYQQDQYARLTYQLEHDSLTGLFNFAHIRKELRRAITNRLRLGIARINLDRFGEINAAHGHMIGDEVLVEVAAMLKSVDTGDVVTRVSGDDFLILLKELVSEDELRERIGHYSKIFEQPFHTGDRDGSRFLPVTCSIGAALFPRDAGDYERLMTCADVALASAKESGGSALVVFSESLRAAEQLQGIQRSELLEGLVADTFVLEYQPTFDLATRGIVGAEALIRWNHPTRGRLLPADFMPSADHLSAMMRLTNWVLARIFRDLRGLALPPGFRCYMNVPARVIDDNAFLLNLERELIVTPELAHHIGIEITESEVMQNVDKVIVTLEGIRRRGVRVAIDDFGTGYSSLAYLKRLPVDVVKLDRAFVEGLPDEPRDVNVTELFLEFTRRMGVTSVAEGIETERQAEWLLRHGCQIGQGYLVSASVPIEQLPGFFARATVLPKPKQREKGDHVA